MKLLYVLWLSLASLAMFSCKTQKVNDSVKKADRINEIRTETGTVDPDAAAFLVKIADARMMDAKEGALAVSRGTTTDVRNYGKLMVKDQAILLAEIRKIAGEMRVSLPTDISTNKQDGYSDLVSKQGEEFDEKFLKMMKIDHERDIDDFTKAAQLTNRRVNQFAVARLPLILLHLDKLKVLKEQH